MMGTSEEREKRRSRHASGAYGKQALDVAIPLTIGNRTVIANVRSRQREMSAQAKAVSGKHG